MFQESVCHSLNILVRRGCDSHASVRSIWLGYFLDVRSVKCESHVPVYRANAIRNYFANACCTTRTTIIRKYLTTLVQRPRAIVAAIPAGSLVGSLMVTWLGDRIGRKRTIIIAGIIWVVGSTLQCAAMVSACFAQRHPFCSKFCYSESRYARSWPYYFRYFCRSLVCHRPDLSI